MGTDTSLAIEGHPSAVTSSAAARWRSPDWLRALQLALASVWLVDGVLQLDPFMFTPGSSGFSGMLNSMATGNPHWVARSIIWNGSLVYHHPVLVNSVFALTQIVIGLGIALRAAVRPALAASVAWSLGVWWFGEGFGGVLAGKGTPIGGGPGAVVFYALLAILLWPAEREAEALRFAAARGLGERAAKAVWAVLWLGMAFLALFGSGRSPQGVQSIIETANAGQPGWLAAIDRHAASAVANQGLTVAIVVAIACLAIAGGVFLGRVAARATLVLLILMALVIWVVGENFGMILAGGATDPNSGPLLVLMALAYWPLNHQGALSAPSSAGTVLARISPGVA